MPSGGPGLRRSREVAGSPASQVVHAPAASPASAILALQRTAGNRAVAELLERSPRVDPALAGDRVGRAIGSDSRPIGDRTQLHTDAPAQRLTRELGVPALAVGSHVFATPEVSPPGEANAGYEARAAALDMPLWRAQGFSTPCRRPPSRSP